ncbi:MAG: glycosyltransferase [Bacteroidota bacterium]
MKKKLCIIYPNKSSSSETFIQAHVKYLPFQNFCLHGGWFPKFDNNDIPISFHSDFNFFEKIKNKIISEDETNFLERGLKNFLLKNKIDVVLAEYGLTGINVMSICQKLNIPLVVHFHGFDIYQKSIVEANYKSYLKLFELSSALIVVSKDMLEKLVMMGAPKEKIHYNSCGVDISMFAPFNKDYSKPNFLFAGRFVNKKAPQLVIMAFSEVVKQIPTAKLVMAGDGGLGSNGELYMACKQIAKALKIEDRIDFKGSLTNNEMAQEMKKATIFIQHSVLTENGDSEGTPVTLLEASASALGIIATRHGGIKDVVIDLETGLLVNEYDLDGTIKCMMDFATNPIKTEKMGFAARERIIDFFSMERSIKNLSRIINSSVNN